MRELLPINPIELGPPRGYSNGILAPAGGRLLFVAGQIGWNRKQELVKGGFTKQFRQALKNVAAVVTAAGGETRNVAQLTIYVVDKQLYVDQLTAVGKAYRAVMGKHFPAMSLLEVKSLLEADALVEIEAIAVLQT